VRETLSSGHHVVWSRPASARQGTDLVLVIHGYGANEVRAAQAYFPMLPEGATGLAVRGGFEIDAGAYPVADGTDGLGSGPGGPDPGAWGWFLLDYFLANDFAEVVAAAHRVFDVLDAEEVTRHGFRSVSVLGHSQGMAMASTAYRLRPEAFTCVVGLSGFVLSNPLLETLDSPPEGPGPRPFFWGRDVADLVINPDAIAYTSDWLDEHTRLTARTYEGMGHGTSPEEARDVRIFLTYALKA
jgi:phospholipase/carboxylesterase